MSAYDNNNIFARILRGEIPAEQVLETEHALAIRDVAPQAPVHVLVLPKGAHVTLADFLRDAGAEEQAGFFAAIGAVVTQLGLEPGGFRVIFNAGTAARQEVMHLHCHVLGGQDLGALLP